MTLTQLFTNIANAIRGKKGTSELIKAEDFADEITNLPSGESFVVPDGMKFAYTGQLPEDFGEWDFSNVTNMDNMFRLTTFSSFPLIDTSNVTSMSYTFGNNYQIETIPLLNTSKVTEMQNTFNSCSNLKNVPLFDTSNVTSMNRMFRYVDNLTDESINNIMKMCVNATKYYSSKTLYSIGLENTTKYSAERISALSNYQEFIDAGWTIR